MTPRILTAHSLITGPTVEPIDLDEVKKVLRFSPTSEDTLIDVWISMARQHFEEQTGRQLMTATWEYWLDGVPEQRDIELPHPPLQNVVSVTYDDADGEAQTFDAASYLVTAPSGPCCAPGRIRLVSAGTWPTLADTGHGHALRIRYTAGYGDAPGDVPELVKGALYFLAGHFHEYRAETQDAPVTSLPLGAEAILKAFKYSALPTQTLTRSGWTAPLVNTTWP